MSLEQLFAQLRRAGIFIEKRGEDLSVSGPRGALTPELQHQIRERKPEIVRWLSTVQHSTHVPIPPLRALPRRSPLPLSFSQQRLWFLEQLEPGTSAYNIPWLLSLTGPLHIDCLQLALDDLVRRHESLRTNFEAHQGSPVQRIQEAASVELETRDFSHQPLAAINEYLSAEAHRPFELGSGLLLRAILIRKSRDDHVLLMLTHHIVTDGASMAILLRDLVEFYRSRREGRAPDLPELVVQYADYALWQRNWIERGGIQSQLDYWTRHLSDAPPVLELATDYPRPPIQSFRGAWHAVSVNSRLTASIRTLAVAHECTPFMVTLAIFCILLNRYTGQHDLLVGAPVAGRNRMELENLVGFFINSVVLRIDLSAEPSFRELLARVRVATLSALSHQDLPFERLAEVLHPERDLSHSPVFQVMFDYQDVISGECEAAGVTWNPETFVSHGTSNFDISLSVGDRDTELDLRFEYATDLFESDTVARLAEHYLVLLEHALSQPDTSIHALRLLTNRERVEILETWNRTEREFPKDRTIHELIARQAARNPETVAVEWNGRCIQYADLEAHANRLAHHLIGLGVGPDQKVGLCMERSSDMIVAILGILKAGGAYVPMDPAYPTDRLQFMLRDSGLAVLVTQESLANLIDAGDIAQVVVDRSSHRAEIDARPALAPDTRIAAGHLAYVIYTSGSSGRPKGVMVEHAGLTNYTWQIGERTSVTRGTRMLQFASISFDIAAEEIFTALSHGATLVIRDEQMTASPAKFFDTCASERIEWLSLPTAYWHELAGAVGNGEASVPDCLDWLIIGGEKARWDMLQAWQRNADDRPRLLNTYGPTEATVVATWHEVTRADERSRRHDIPIGKPIPNVQTYILDHRGEPQPIGIPGELHIGGVGLARGYLGREDLTQDKFLINQVPNFIAGRTYRTGDRVRYLPDGNIAYLGRVDDQFKLRGYRIEPGEIQSVLTQMKAVDTSLVMLREDDPGNPRLVAYVTSEDSTLTPRLLHEHASERLPEYMVPSAFTVLNEIPLSTNGKVDHAALPVPDQTAMVHGGYVAPRNPLEQTLAELFAEVLGASRIGVHDDFFALGGHSLLAAKLVSQIRDAMSVELPLRYLFSHPTVAGIAAELDTSVHKAARARPVPRPEGMNQVPLAFAQRRFWFLDRLEPGNPAYNLHWSARLSGNLDVACLQTAVDRLVARHESLRSCFHEHDGEGFQLIRDEASVTVETTKLNHVSKSALDECIRDLVHRPFNLTKGPLFRVSVIECGPQSHVLLLVMHHIIADGWSMAVLLRELAAGYDALSLQTEPTLARLPLQYRDYAVWQRNWLSGGELERQLDYWHRALADVPHALELPQDREHPVGHAYSGAWVTRELPKCLSDAAGLLARDQGCTLYMVLLAAFNVLLARHSGQEDLVVGTPVSGRHYSELENLIGLFLNTLAIRVDLSGNPSFRTLLDRVKDSAADAYAHPDVPFEKLVEELNPDRDFSQPPIVQVMFQLHQGPRQDFRLRGLKVEPFVLENEYAKVKLNVHVGEHAGRLRLAWQYATDLFDSETVDVLADRYQNLLESIVGNPDLPIGALPMIGEAEHSRFYQLRKPQNRQSVPGPFQSRTLVDRFAHMVGIHGARPAVSTTEGSWSYDELDRLSNGVAGALVRAGVNHGDRVALLFSQSRLMIASIIGVLKAGAAYVPLDPLYPVHRLHSVLSDVGASALLAGRQWTELANHLDVEIPILDADSIFPAEKGPQIAIGSDDLAYVLYTSGSTGEPKGVMQTHRAVLHHAASYSNALGLVPRDRLTLLSTYCFDAMVQDVFGALVTGCCVCPMDLRVMEGAEELVKSISTQDITVYHSTPTAFRFLFAESSAGSADLSCVRLVVLGGEETRRADFRRFQMQFGDSCQFVNGLGLTEYTNVTQFHAHRESHVLGQTVPVGKPVPGTRVVLLNADGKVADVRGEIAVGSEYLFTGYWNRPDAIAAVLVDDPEIPNAKLLRTGDMARRLPDGTLVFSGRTDGRVKIRGYRIETGEVEAVLMEQPGITSAAVVARERSHGEYHLAGYVAGRSSAEELRSGLRARLPEYMVPASLTVLDALPTLPNGKVDRKNLPEPEWSSGSGVDYIAPRNSAESTLAAIWTELLGVDEVSVRDDFFALGGHSLLATRLVSRLRDALGVEIPLVALFERPRLEDFAEIVQLAPSESGSSKPKLIPRQNRQVD